MANKLFLRGPCGIGKSTVLAAVKDALIANGKTVAGINTFHDLAGGQKIYLSDLNQPDNRQVIADYSQGFVTYGKVFDNFGCQLIKAAQKADIIYLDELGFIEAKSPLFIQAIYDLLEQDKPVIGVLRLKEIAWHQPIMAHHNVQLLSIDEHNRNDLAQIILAAVTNSAISVASKKITP